MKIITKINVNGIIMHSGLVIQLNKNINGFKTLMMIYEWKCTMDFICLYDMKMLNAIDYNVSYVKK